MKKYLSLSVVTATYNSVRTIERNLQSVRSQDYPQDKIEIIVADGGSKDETREIAHSYGAKIIRVDPKLQSAEYNKSIGINAARGEIILMLDHDNVLPHKLWLSKMLKPFFDHPEVVGTETLRYHYDPSTTLIDRYFALFGAGDPIVWYLGKADRLSFIYDRYNLLGEAKDCGSYYLVKFQAGEIPTVGANGFLVRRSVLMQYAKTSPGSYFDMDVNVDIIKAGFDTYAFVKDSVLHLTGYGNALNYLRRRILFITQYHLGEKGLALKAARRYEVFEKKDLLKLILVIFICLTLIIPFIDSLRGWRKIHDPAWFLHPFLSFAFVVLYSWVIIKHQFNFYAEQLLGK